MPAMKLLETGNTCNEVSRSATAWLPAISVPFRVARTETAEVPATLLIASAVYWMRYKPVRELANCVAIECVHPLMSPTNWDAEL